MDRHVRGFDMSHSRHKHFLLHFYVFQTILNIFCIFYNGTPTGVTYMQYMSPQRHMYNIPVSEISDICGDICG